MDFNEKKGWQDWHAHHADEPAGLMKKIWEGSTGYKNDYQPDVHKGFEAFKLRMDQASPKVVRLSPIRLALRIAAGAALLLVATMVLRQFVGTSDNQRLAATQASETKDIVLSDNSKVALNQNSTLHYETAFSAKKRNVELNGEAFFKITRDEKRPFTVETATALVQVLGTSFNIRSYPNEDFFEVFVETGKVKVVLKANGQSFELVPGQYLRLNKTNNKVEKGLDKTASASAWHTGSLSFKGQPIPLVLKGMERLYGVKMELQSAQRKGCEQTLTVQKGKLEEAIQALKTSCPKLNFTKNGSAGYIVTGTCCD